MDGRQTGWHGFLRGDQLSDLTDRDIEILLDYGVKTVMDLRSASETAKRPDHPDLLNRVRYCHIPFLEEDLSPQGQADMKEALQDLSGLYLSLLKRKTVIRQIFLEIQSAPQGCILFHCTAGKDRTGVLSLLLLMLAGANRQDCQTNYMQSFTNLTRNEIFTRLSEKGYYHLVRSEADDIMPSYDYIASFPQGILGFLHDCGVPASCVEQVRLRCF